MDRNFREMLAKRQIETNSLVCVGLDPLVEKIPKRMRWAKWWQKILIWPIWPNFIRIFVHMAAVADRTAEHASMFKPQAAHYEAVFLGTLGLYMLARYIRRNYPDIPVFLDCKRGDIERTQGCYGNAWLDLFGFDGMNFSPYMGSSCLSALYNPKRKGKALVSLCYTSNSDAREVQDLKLADGSFLWEQMALFILHWAKKADCLENAGLVMAAAYRPTKTSPAYTHHLESVRELVGNQLWFLIPGIGTQGGEEEETVRAAYRGPGSIAVNSSSKICFADDPGAEANSLKVKLAKGVRMFMAAQRDLRAA